jgi:hypothetical protein
VRELSNIEFINVGRISRSLSTRSKDFHHRPNVYIVQVKEENKPAPDLHVLRFQKWCVSEHLDEGKDLVQAIMEAADYTDYILDRRLGCRQLGMNLPDKVTNGRIREVYTGANKQYHGVRCWVIYFERDYIKGSATDKISARRYANPEFNRRLGRLLGEAAATNMIVGRTYSDKRVMFDDGDEVCSWTTRGSRTSVIVSDHTGTFTEYQCPLHVFASAYAAAVNARAPNMPNAHEFAEIYLAAFLARFERIQQEYLRRKRAFDNLFKHLPVDPKGSSPTGGRHPFPARQHSAPALAQAIRSHIEVMKKMSRFLLFKGEQLWVIRREGHFDYCSAKFRTGPSRPSTRPARPA